MKGVEKRIANMKKLYGKLSDQFWRAKSRYIKYYDSLPIDEKTILLESEHGKKLDGNIFYILRYLSHDERYADYRICLSSMGRYKKRFQSFLLNHDIHNIEIIMLASDEYMRILASAKYLINDTSFGPYFIKKEGQIYLNTWHGTPLKAMGRQDSSGFASLGNVQKNLAISDYLLFPNSYTRHHMIQDYMLENISYSRILMGGYPRNEAFFDGESRERIRGELGLTEKRIYAYLPTWRGSPKSASGSKDYIYLSYFLYEIDGKLEEDEVLYVNLHPLGMSNIDFKRYKRIYPFPRKYEIYEFLNVADTLITDYSSVFFDYAITHRKVILFPYDKADYLENRGMYLQLEELPFPKVYSVETLIGELRSRENCDLTGFLEEFCPYDNDRASQAICDKIILGIDTGIVEELMPNNGKENVLIYAGNLAGNGITASLRNLTQILNLDKRNYYISFIQEHVRKNVTNLKTFSEQISYYVTTGDMNLTIRDRIIRKLFKKKLISAQQFMNILGKRVKQNFLRNYGHLRFDHVVQFNGYEQEVILTLSTFPGKTTIFVHNDMLQEIATKRNQRRDVLKYAYQNYDTVAVVTEDILEPTYAIAGRKDNILVVKNAIDYQSICEKGMMEISLAPFTKNSVTRETFFEIISSPRPKFINIGRFSVEKGHDRLIDAFYRLWQSDSDICLIIMGGYVTKNCYAELLKKIEDYGMENHVILLQRVSNPYPILKACDYFILSSLYEGFGLVIAEADILEKPVVSTDIPGPRGFMSEHGGTMVESSEEGIYQGLRMLYEGKVQPMCVNYEAYNQDVLAQFEQLFQREG